MKRTIILRNHFGNPVRTHEAHGIGVKDGHIVLVNEDQDIIYILTLVPGEYIEVEE